MIDIFEHLNDAIDETEKPKRIKIPVKYEPAEDRLHVSPHDYVSHRYDLYVLEFDTAEVPF